MERRKCVMNPSYLYMSLADCAVSPALVFFVETSCITCDLRARTPNSCCHVCYWFWLQAGVVTISERTCQAPCEQPRYVPGQCCPVCAGELTSLDQRVIRPCRTSVYIMVLALSVGHVATCTYTLANVQSLNNTAIDIYHNYVIYLQ